MHNLAIMWSGRNDFVKPLGTASVYSLYRFIEKSQVKPGTINIPVAQCEVDSLPEKQTWTISSISVNLNLKEGRQGKGEILI